MLDQVDTFEIGMLLLMTIFMVVKIYLTSKHTTQAATANNYPARIGIFQGVHAFLLLLPYLWVVGIFDLDLLVLDLPQWIRWLSMVGFVGIIGLMIWQMRALSVNISATHAERYLVTSGPYKIVRHPLYLVFVLIMIDSLLISANLIFLVAIIPAAIAAKVRADYEENLLREEHGDAYTQYQKTTPQLFPRM